MTNVYLVASVRTPIGRFGGTLASWSAADLGVAAAKESIQRAGLTPDQIQQSIWGCARQAGGGPNVARQITFRAGVPETVPAFTVNQACGSGLQAIMLAAQQIILGRAEIVLAGGTESMSRVPYFAEGAPRNRALAVWEARRNGVWPAAPQARPTNALAWARELRRLTAARPTRP